MQPEEHGIQKPRLAARSWLANANQSRPLSPLRSDQIRCRKHDPSIQWSCVHIRPTSYSYCVCINLRVWVYFLLLNLKFDILQCSCQSQAVMAGTITLPVREKPALTESGGIGREGGRIPFGREMRKQFLFDENFVNLNHGNFWKFLQLLYWKFHLVYGVFLISE